MIDFLAFSNVSEPQLGSLVANHSSINTLNCRLFSSTFSCRISFLDLSTSPLLALLESSEALRRAIDALTLDNYPSLTKTIYHFLFITQKPRFRAVLTDAKIEIVTV